jgi:hypothetical protein
MLKAEYVVAQRGITIPYSSKSDTIRRNHGFVDLRGRPDLAREISEGSASAALKSLLVCLSGGTSSILTLGCDLGEHQEGKRGSIRQLAGGYVQIMAANYKMATAQSYLEFARDIEKGLRKSSTKAKWEFRFELTPVSFQLESAEELTPSLCIWFMAEASTLATASKSRETLIDELCKVLITRSPFTLPK